MKRRSPLRVYPVTFLVLVILVVVIMNTVSPLLDILPSTKQNATSTIEKRHNQSSTYNFLPATPGTPQTEPTSSYFATHQAAMDNSTDVYDDEDKDIEFLPRPLQVWRQYQQMHSTRQLQSEYDSGHYKNKDYSRKFSVAYYYCPRRAGNILHNLFISVSWAVIHNRTLMIQYDTDSHHGSTEEECQKILKLASWLPMWTEWKDKLQLSDPVPVQLDKTRVKYDEQPSVVVFPQIRDVCKNSSSIFRIEWRDDPSHSRKNIEYMLGLDRQSKIRATMLWDYGVDFLFGMFFQELFTVQFKVINPFEAHDQNNITSVALHSRHTVVEDDGSFVTDEIKCLNQILPQHRTMATCVVYLMSDRPKTVENLLQWLRNNNCTGVTASHQGLLKETVITNEMGPNQGEGFIRELQLASSARTAVVGDFHRSSFMLLVELVKYKKRMQEWFSQGNGSSSSEDENQESTLNQCSLPARYGSGYDYGPGTPRFVAKHHRTDFRSDSSPDRVKKQV